MGDFLERAKALANEHDDKVDQGLDKLGDLIDNRPGGKYADKIDRAVDEAQKRTGDGDHVA